MTKTQTINFLVPKLETSRYHTTMHLNNSVP